MYRVNEKGIEQIRNALEKHHVWSGRIDSVMLGAWASDVENNLMEGMGAYFELSSAFSKTKRPVTVEIDKEGIDLLPEQLAEMWLDEADSTGMSELRDGLIFLFSKEGIMAEQEDWPDEDTAKLFDFSTSDYWLQALPDRMKAVTGVLDLIDLAREMLKANAGW